MVPISIGELIDKITILEIKSERVMDASKLENIRQELTLLLDVRRNVVDSSTPSVQELTAELKKVNEIIWDAEDGVRDCQRRNQFDTTFMTFTKAAHTSNDRRFALKRQLNELLGSKIIEEKSYGRDTKDSLVGEH